MRARVDPGQTGQRDDAARASASARLPMFPETGPRVPLLELADVRGGPIMARGRGAPLDLRIFVGAVLWTPHHARASGRTSRLIRWRGFQVEPAFRILEIGRYGCGVWRPRQVSDPDGGRSA